MESRRFEMVSRFQIDLPRHSRNQTGSVIISKRARLVHPALFFAFPKNFEKYHFPFVSGSSTTSDFGRKVGINSRVSSSNRSQSEMHTTMSASSRKLFREYHRELRLKQFQPGNDTTFEVRPLSLTPSQSKIINIKDSNSQKSNESK